MKCLRPRHALSCVALASLLLLGCAGDSKESLIASARVYLDKNDVPAAVIQLKNALQQDPQSGEARFLLGTTLLRMGDAAAASIELRKALEAGHERTAVLPSLARALLLEGQAKAVIDEYGSARLDRPVAAAELQTTLAQAFLAQGRPDEAEQALGTALEAVPDHSAARLMQARLRMSRQDVPGALSMVETAIAKAPLDPDAWQLKGDILLYGRSDAPGSLEAFRRSVSLQNDHVLAHKGILTVLMAGKDTEAVKGALDSMKQALPRHAQTKYFEAQFALRQRDLKVAKEHVNQLLRVAPDSVEALQLAGWIEAESGALLQAEKHFTRALTLASDLPLARRLLAETYVRGGQSVKALEVAEPLLSKGTQDADLLALVAQAHLMTGDALKAEELLMQASKADPDHVRTRVALALTRIGKKRELEAGLDELRAVAQVDPSGFADMALISVHLRRGHWQPALDAIAALERKQPDKPLTATMRGVVQLALKNEPAARLSFERALAIDPGYFSAIARLAALDLADGQPAAAKKRFEQVLALDAKNVQALLGLAALEARTGGSAEAVANRIADAVKLNPGAAAPRLLLIEQHLRHKDVKAALAVAQEAVAALPESADLLDALGRVQALDGQPNQAANTFAKLATLEPRSARPYSRLADLQLAKKNPEAAIQSWKRALVVSPQMLTAQRSLVMLYVANNRPKEALAIVQAVQKQRPDDGVGHVLEGDFERSQKNWTAAIAAYRTALKISQPDEAAAKLHSALVQAGKAAEADTFATAWIKQHPKHAEFHLYLAEQAIGRGDAQTAHTHYAAVVDLQPQNAAVLNNLAWVMAKLDKPGALSYAEKAHALRPNEPSIMDTLATILATENEVDKAVELQAKAVSLSPTSHTFRLNLAKLYIQAGQKDRARAELDILAKVEPTSGAQAEVADLLKRL